MNKRALIVAGVVLLIVVGLAVVPADADPEYPATIKIPVHAAVHDPTDGQNGNRIAAIEARLAKMDEKLDALLKIANAVHAQDAQEKPPADDIGPVARVNKTLGKCVGCHGEADYLKKGGEFRMFTGTQLREDLSALQIKRIKERTTSQNPATVMPPPKSGTLTADEIAGLNEWFVPKP